MLETTIWIAWADVQGDLIAGDIDLLKEHLEDKHDWTQEWYWDDSFRQWIRIYSFKLSATHSTTGWVAISECPMMRKEYQYAK